MCTPHVTATKLLDSKQEITIGNHSLRFESGYRIASLFSTDIIAIDDKMEVFVENFGRYHTPTTYKAISAYKSRLLRKGYRNLTDTLRTIDAYRSLAVKNKQKVLKMQNRKSPIPKAKMRERLEMIDNLKLDAERFEVLAEKMDLELEMYRGFINKYVESY